MSKLGSGALYALAYAALTGARKHYGLDKETPKNHKQEKKTCQDKKRRA